MPVLKHKTRHALLMSLTSLMLCVSMLVGATFAWFTDSVTSGVNRIVSGNLDVELLHANHDVTAATSVKGDTLLFNAAADEGTILWEPGAASYETFTIQNKGTLNLKYQFAVNNLGNNTMTDTTKSLLNAIRVGVSANESDTVDSIKSGITTTSATLADLISGANYTSNFIGSLAPSADKTFTVVLYWPQSADDNNWNPETTGTNTYDTSDGKQLWVDLGITLVATQATGEYDSFGYEYDANAEQPADGWEGISTVGKVNTSATSSVTSNQATTLTSSDNSVKATISENATSATSLTLTVTPTTSTAENATAITTTEGTEYYEITLKNQNNQVVESFADNGYADVELKIGEDLTDLVVYHKSTPLTTDTSATEYYSYASDTGILTLHVTSFSPFSIGFNGAVAKIGITGYATLAKAMQAAKDDDTINLIKDVTLTESVNAALGGTVTLDLNGKTISGDVDDMITVSSGSLTVNDTSSSKTGAIVTSESTAINFGGGKLTINGGTISAGTVSTEENSYAAYGITVSITSGDVVINGGTITGIGEMPRPIHFENCAGNITVNGGKIVADGSYCAYGIEYNKGSSGTITIKGGSITAKSTNSSGESYAINHYGNGAVNITGGTFTVEGNNDIKVVYFTGRVNNVSITGGTFDSDPTEFVRVTADFDENWQMVETRTTIKLVPDGYAATLDNGTWTVSKTAE